MISTVFKFDTKLDLLLERDIDVPPDLVWTVWTTPKHLRHWFVPKPWTITDCEIDLRPGGMCRTVMRSPEGQEFPNLGCYLEVVRFKKLVWTSALAPGFRPMTLSDAAAATCGPFQFTAVISLAPHGNGTRYSALVMHSDESGRKQHEAMGFQEGWGKALDQLVAHMKKQ